VGWLTSAILVLGKLRKKDSEFEAILDYTSSRPTRDI
jgi:hypothetical protein